ncbi:MAG: ATP-dependent RNA helicase HrpA, partial [Acidimicrobiia bacterium]
MSNEGTLGAVSYPAELPITAHRDEILDALGSHQILVVAGETGSGKSTQLPKMLLEMAEELGFSGWIGHTQPRRIAARSVAERIAEELATELGSTVGFTVRFNDQVSKRTRIKLMTDGILLAEIQRDPQLNRYSALIIDEAHERSLNIDFLLGYLRSLLPRRPELRVIITSATIDTERFAEYFADARQEPAPIISVSGRTYPVEMRYRPLGERADQVDGIVDAVGELAREEPGDILVFLTGERDIRDAEDALAGLGLHQAEIVPLYARLSAAEQHRIFAPHRGRRIVLATNIAETSLTVPGIRYVIDPGQVRISRYNQRTKVQRLPIEKVSQASADQRAGRCGRIGPGICIRLYSEDDFEERSEFTDPEITRTNLASVILQMASIGLAPNGPDDIIDFPFVESPDTRNITDGVRLLEELGAVDLHPEAPNWLTGLGRRLARLPVDPRIARMIIAADEWNCLDSVLVIAAALSIQDPREEPSDKREAARQSHARFTHGSSDLLSLLNLWDYANSQRRERSSGSFRRMCRREFLNHNRLREWQDLYSQLKRIAREMKLDKPVRRRADDVDGDAVHRAVLAGLLSHIGMREEPERRKDAGRNARGKRPVRPRVEYVGARNSRFVLAPGSAISKTQPRWVMAGELVETNRLYARTVAAIDPRWIEDAAERLATYTYTEPAWNPDRGTATVIERATLYGLPIVTGRTINLHRVDPDLARDLFIQEALVERNWETPAGSKLHAFLDQNTSVLAEAAQWEAKTRNRDLEVEAEAVRAHYD